MSALFAGLEALALIALAQPSGDRAQLEDQLEAQRSVLELLGSSSADVKGALAALDQMATAVSVEHESLRRRVAVLGRRVVAVERLENAVNDELFSRRRALQPSLVVLYRVSRKDRLSLLLSSDDFVTAVRRARGIRTGVGHELEELRRLDELGRYQRLVRRQLDDLRASAKAEVAFLEQKTRLSRLERRELLDLLGSLNANAALESRGLRQLEYAEHQLEELAAEARAMAPANGFRSRRGFLPYPARGMIEAGFGRVLNPRFNTFTIRKGIDVRAPKGRQVVSVFEGTVVYVGVLKGYGNVIIVEHPGGYHTVYAHLGQVEVEPGNEVELGESIGTVGETGSDKGSYLYFEIRHNGQAIDPIPWLSEEPP